VILDGRKGLREDLTTHLCMGHAQAGIIPTYFFNFEAQSNDTRPRLDHEEALDAFFPRVIYAEGDCLDWACHILLNNRVPRKGGRAYPQVGD
jgi:hypothetical protein